MYLLIRVYKEHRCNHNSLCSGYRPFIGQIIWTLIKNITIDSQYVTISTVTRTTIDPLMRVQWIRKEIQSTYNKNFRKQSNLTRFAINKS